MPNANPIKVDKPQVSTIFDIPAAQEDTPIFLSIKIDLNAPNWTYQDTLSVFLDGNNIYPAGTPMPTKLTLGTGAAVNGLKLLVKTSISLFYSPGGFSGNFPVYQYTLSFDAGGVNLATFTAGSAQNNPAGFNSLTLFNQLA